MSLVCNFEGCSNTIWYGKQCCRSCWRVVCSKCHSRFRACINCSKQAFKNAEKLRNILPLYISVQNIVMAYVGETDLALITMDWGLFRNRISKNNATEVYLDAMRPT